MRFLLQATEASRYDFPGGSRHTGTMFRALRVPGYRSPRYDFPGGSRLTSAIFRGLRVPGYRSPQVRFSGRLQTHRYDFPGASSPQVRVSGRLQTHRYDFPGASCPDSQVRFSGRFQPPGTIIRALHPPFLFRRREGGAGRLTAPRIPVIISRCRRSCLAGYRLH